jgi:hypothetical protein
MGFLTRLFHISAIPSQDDPALEQALERTALRIDPNLRLTRHWPDRYRPAIGSALTQARRVAQDVPGPVLLDRESWIKDPFVHTLFASTEEMRRAVSASSTLLNFVTAHGGGEVHALLSLRREEKHSYGMESSGDVLRRDVAQRVIWFTDPHFIGAAANEMEARNALLWTLFDRFLERLAVGVDRIRVERQRLIQEKDMVQAHLRGAPALRRPTLEQDLLDHIKRLTEIGENLDPERMHEVFDTILSHPEDCLYLEPHPFNLDALGVVQTENTGPAVTALNFVDLLERYQAPRTVVLVRCQNVTPSTMAERLGEASHWL